MIPRLLVPFDARPSALEPTARRRPSTLDDRTLVPPGLAVTPLDAISKIPANLPLESIAKRFIVPRDLNPEAYQVREEAHALPPQPSEMDERITVPLGAASPEIIPPPPRVSEELVSKDVFLSGEVNFLADAEVREKNHQRNLWTAIGLYAGVLFAEIGAFVALLILASLFHHEPTQSDLEIARKQMTLLLPPGAFEMNRPEPRVAPPPHVRVDPRVLRQIAPPEPVPAPAPQPRTPARELPSAPTVKPEASQPPPAAPTPKTEAPPNTAPKLEAPDAPTTKPNLTLPKSSGNPLRDTLQDMARNPSHQGGLYSAPDPRPFPGGSGRQGGGAPGVGMGSAVQILTPTEGVDFNDYIQRVLASVKRNWYAVMPESAQLGDKGIVTLEFSIHRDGSVPSNEPDRVRGSGKEPLDRAAISAIRSSNPFDHLPPAFTGPEIRLRFIFLYNLPVEAANQQ